MSVLIPAPLLRALILAGDRPDLKDAAQSNGKRLKWPRTPVLLLSVR
jgi:hypothetical protein